VGATYVTDPAPPRRLGHLAATQHGVFARAQALACGVNARAVARRVSAGAYERLHPGVYRVAGAPATWRQALIAACLACGRAAAVSHLAAAALWGLAGFEPGRVELTARRARRRVRGCVLHWSSLAPGDVKRVDGIPVTSVARTLADLAGCVRADALEEALDDALRRRLVTVAGMRKELRRRRPGVKVLGRLIDARAGMRRVPETVFETKLLRVLRAGGLPLPAVQHWIGRYRVDFAYTDERLVIEADGFQWHSSRRQWDRDRAQRATLAELGWRVVPVTWTQLVSRPREVVGAVRAALGARTP